ncbi:hypothetical protein ABPG74_001281 [Tetrahymena malaccensis]
MIKVSYLAFLLIGLSVVSANLIRISLKNKNSSYKQQQNLRDGELYDQSFIDTLFNHNQQLYSGEIQVGLSQKKFQVDFDTGSSLLWLTSKDCKSCLRDGFKNSYQCNQDDGCVQTDIPASIGYEDGSSVKGYIAKVPVSISNLQPITNAILIVEQSVKNKNLETDGLIGLGVYDQYNSNNIPYVESLYRQGIIQKSQFSFYLGFGEKESELVIGGYDQNKIQDQNKIYYHPILLNVKQNNDQDWSVTLSAISFDGIQIPVSSKNIAIVDSGTSTICIRKDIYSILIKHLKQNYDIKQQLQLFGSVYTVKCGKVLPDLNFVLPDKEGIERVYSVPSSFYIFQQGNKCYLGVESQSVDDDVQFILGNVFMRRFVSIFDYSSMSIDIGCGLGCSNCISSKICQSCKQDFVLDEANNVCNYSKCDSNLLASQEQTSQNQDFYECVAICGQNEIADYSQQTCNKVYQCSLENEPKKYNNGVTVNQIGLYMNQYICLIYDDKYNVFSLANGQYIISQQYLTNEQIILGNQNMFKVDLQNGLVSLVDIIDGSQITVFTLQSGQNFSDFQFQIIDQNYAIITSTDQYKQSNYINIFPYLNIQNNKLSHFQLNGQKLVLKQPNLILTQEQNQLINIYELQINNQTGYYDLTSILSQNKQCNILQNLNQISNLFKINENLIVFTTTENKNLYQFDSQSQVCNESLITDSFITIKYLRTEKSIFIMYAQKIEIYSLPNFSLQNQQSFKYALLDFEIVNTTLVQQSYQVYFLGATSQISIYQLKFSNSNIQFQLQKNISIYISNPIRIQASYQNNSSPIILVYNYDCQVIDPNISDSLFSLQNFQANYPTHQQNVIQIVQTNDEKFLISASSDGEIIAWQLLNRYRGETFITFDKLNDTCSQILVYFNRYIFQNCFTRLLIIDLINPYNKSILVKTDQLSSSLITANSQFAIINKDSCLIKYDNQLNVVNNQCSSNYQLLNQIYLQENNQLITVSGALIQQLDASQNASPFNVISSYTHISNIQILKFRSYSDFKCKCIFIDQMQQLIVLSQSLTIEYQVQIKQFQQIFDLNFPSNIDKEDYMVLGYVDNQSEINKCQVYLFSQQNSSPQFVFKFPYVTQIISVIYRLNSQGNQQYLITPLMPLSVVSLVYPVIYDINLQYLYFGSFPDLYFQFSTVNVNIQNQYAINNYIGTQSGYVGTTTLFSNKSKQVHISPSNQPINKFFQNMRLERYFILSYNVFIYNIHSDEQEEILVFQDQNNLCDIYTVNNVNQMVLFLKPFEVFVRDYRNVKKYHQTFDQKLYGAFISDQNIFIYGQGFQVYSLSLKQIQTILSDKIILNCIFGNQLYVCKQDPTNLVIINPLKFNIIINFEVLNMPNGFNFYFDETSQRIFAYELQLIIFSYQGIQKGLLVTESQNAISNIYQFGDKLLASFNAGVMICDYKSMKFLTNLYTADAAQILKIIYIQDTNMIAYFTTSTRYGQIYFYSLQNLNSAGTFFTATFNSQSLLIDICLDSNMAEIIYIDYEGNIANVIYSNISEDNSSNLSYLFPNTSPIGMDLSLETNTILVSDKLSAYKINYSQMVQTYIQLFNSFTFQYASVQFSGQNYYLILDSSNIVYQYNQFQLVQILRFNEKILDMWVIGNNQQIVIIAFRKQIITFLPTLSTSIQMNQLNVITNYMYKQYLGGSTFFTYDNKLVYFDFVNKKEIYSFQFDKTQNIINDFQYISSENKLVIGFFTGQVYVYYYQSLKVKELTITQQVNDQIIRVIYTSQCIYAFYRNGDILNLYENSVSQIILTPQSSYTNSQIQFELSNAYFDDLFNRLYVNFQDQQKLFVLDASTFKIIKYLSHGSDSYNRVYQGDNLLILYTTYQLNIYTRDTLKFIQFIQKNSRTDTIDQINLIQDTYLIVCYTTKIDIFLLNNLKFSYQLIDSLSGQFVKLIHSQINVTSNQQTILVIIFFSAQQITENYYSIDLILSGSNQCSYSLVSQNNLQATLQFQQVYLTDLNIQYAFYYQIVDSLDIFNSIQGTNFQIIVNPQINNNDQIKPCQNQLNLHNNSFLSLKNNVMINCFSFNFTQKGIYLFNPVNDKIILQNINIQNQDISQISLNLSNQDTIVIQNLVLDGVNITSSGISAQGELIQNLILIQNCTTLNIYGLTIKNINLQYKYPIFFIQNVQKVIIKNITISQGTFSQLFQFESCDQIDIEAIVIDNNTGYYQLNSTFSLGYLLQISGSRQINITNLNASNNFNLNLISSSNIQTMADQTIYLEKDIIVLSKCYILNNTFSDQFLDINGEQSTMILLQNSYLTIDSIQFSFNQENIQISSCFNATIKDSTFQYNTCFNGGAIYANSVSQQLNLINSKFTNNTALGSGGSIFLKNVKRLLVDKNSIIKYNIAQIGGGIRYIFDEQVSENYVTENYQISTKAQIQQNQGFIYGNNLANYPYRARIVFKTESTSIDTQIIDPCSVDQNNKNLTINIDKFQSGGYLNVTLEFLDQENQIVKISTLDFFNQNYLQSIINELKQLNFVLQPISLSQNSIYLSDQSLVNLNQYDQNKFAFIKNSLQISGVPSTNSQFVLIYQTNQVYNPVSLQLQISFRECYKGEVFKIINDNIIQCYQCPNGFYSLTDVYVQSLNALQNLKENPAAFDNIICKKCPDSAVSCQGKNIQLKNGYWRVSELTDEILQCVNNESSCIPEDKQNNKQGCLMGYIGPLCDFCDTEGKLWQDRYTDSSQKYFCSQCSEFHVQIIYISILGLLIFLYIVFQVLSFMSSYVHYQQSYYIRNSYLLPISMSSLKEQSGFFMKILINYLQLTSILLTIKTKIVPSIIMIGPSILGNSMSNLTIDINCIYPQRYISYYGTGRLRQITQFFIPPTVLIILIILFLILERFKVYNIGKYHKYTLISFTFMFFQPDSLNLYSKSLTCRTIGSLNVFTNDTLFSCDDPGYDKFTKMFTIPILIIWIVFPLIPLYFLAKRRKKLNWCSVKLKLGYYYTEFKEFLVSKVLGKEKTTQFFIKNTISVSTLLRWKKIRANLNLLIQEKQISLQLKSKNSSIGKSRSDKNLINYQTLKGNSENFSHNTTQSPMKTNFQLFNQNKIQNKQVYSNISQIMSNKQVELSQIFQNRAKQNSIENVIFPQQDELIEQQNSEHQQDVSSNDLENDIQYQEDISQKSGVICSVFQDGVFNKQNIKNLLTQK